MMKDKVNDNDPQREIQAQFEANAKLIEEQKKLMDQLKSVNEKLLQSEQLKTNFLSNIRNEINNPIASVLELSRHISTGNLKTEEIKKFAELIYNEIFKLDFQLRNILVSAEIEAGESPLSVSLVNVSSLLDSVVNSFANQITKKELKVSINNQIKNDRVFFFTDPEKLHLILSNLVSNAIEFSHNSGTINITCSMEDNALVVSVADKGIGICADDVKKIFDRFSQLQSGTTKSYAGHGLGLCITKALLDTLNGQIDLVSKPEKGSTFTIKVRQSNYTEFNDTMFSSDGNDFLFNNNGGATF